MRWRQQKAFTLQNLHSKIAFFFPLETALKTHQPEGPGTGVAACPDLPHSQERAKTDELLHLSTSVPQLQTCSLTQPWQDLPSLGWCKQLWQGTSFLPCSTSCPPCTPAPGWGWTDRKVSGLKGQGKWSLRPVYLSKNGNSDLQMESDWQIKV